MENENIETKCGDLLIDRIFEGLSGLWKVWGENISFYLAMNLHKDPVSSYNANRERPEKLAIKDKSGKEIPILSVYN